MSPTKDKSKQEEPKETLAAGDPEAAYTTEDLSAQTGTGILPDDEQDWHDARDEAQAEAAEAAADHDDEVAKRRRDEAEKALADTTAKSTSQAPKPKPTTESSS